MNKAELLDEVAENLFAYVMHGEIAEHHIVPKLKPTALDERFKNFNSLVDLHFLLRPDVVDFIETLPNQLRNIKTQTKNVRTTTRGQITGRIDWHSTMTTRYSKSPNNPALFVCNTRNESYDIDENIVLKRLLSLIYTTLDDCDAYLRQEYEWVTDRWKENLELIDKLRDIFEKNVHIKRIRDPEVYEPTERMLQTAASSRNDVYRTAARLLREHRRSRQGDLDALRQLLETTLITPSDEETLFELHVLFQYINAIESRQNGRTTVATIESGRQEVARVENNGGPDIVLYHDNSARDRNLSFVPEPIESMCLPRRLNSRYSVTS